jgi:phospholipid-transporting ATPase
VLAIYTQIAPSFSNVDSKALQGILAPLYGNAAFWFTIIVVPVVCLSRDVIWKYFKRQNLARDYHIIQEIQKFNVPDYRPNADRFDKAVRKVRNIQNLRKNRGYAFSQNEGGQAKLIRQYDTTVEKPSGM